MCDVWLDKDAEDRLTGLLRGSVSNYYTFDPFWTQLLSKLPPMYPSDLVGPTREAVGRYLASGVTTVYETHNMTPGHIRAYQAMRTDGTLGLRVGAAMEVEQYAVPPYQPKTEAEFEQSLELALSLCDDGTDDWLRVSGATLSEGGPCWSGLFRTFEPYRDPYGRPTTGRTFVSREKKVRFARFCAAHDLHANWVNGGPGDNEACLDVLTEVAQEIGLRTGAGRSSTPTSSRPRRSSGTHGSGSTSPRR